MESAALGAGSGIWILKGPAGDAAAHASLRTTGLNHKLSIKFNIELDFQKYLFSQERYSCLWHSYKVHKNFLLNDTLFFT